MANHLSAKKRIRQSEKKRVHNKYYARTVRNAIKKLQEETKKEDAVTALPVVSALLDKVAKKNIIHKNKAANLKSQLSKHVNSL